MDIRVDVARIGGFRGLQNLEITLPRVALLIGTNNSGKTSVIKALQLALGDYSRYHTDEDFFINADDQRVEKILIDVRIVPIGDAGERVQVFNDEWAVEFGEKINSGTDGKQFLALRTQIDPDIVKGGFKI